MKSTPIAYICWLLFGCHYLYLRRPGMQAIYWLTAAGLGVWGLVDLFRLPRMVAACNVEVERDAAWSEMVAAHHRDVA